MSAPVIRVSVVIPARLQSSRLPRKVLLDIGGRTMLERSYEVAMRADCGDVLVLTDDQEVVEVVEGFGGTVWMTDPALESGTARIASVIDRIESEVVVNLQADAPLTDPAIVKEAAAVAARGAADVVMPVYPLADPEAFADPNVVKVVRAGDGRVLYCSRAAVPHARDPRASVARWGHVGIYAYGRAFLENFTGLAPSLLEDVERLEQLRWLEANLSVGSFEVAAQGPSVDTSEQLELVRAAFTA